MSDINEFSDCINPLQELVRNLLNTASHDLVWLRQHTGPQRDVKRWVEERYSSGALLRGVLLAEAEAMLWAAGRLPLSVEEVNALFRRLAMPGVKATLRPVGS